MGVEQPSNYYDAIYLKAKKYYRHYTGVRWLPLFHRAYQLMKRGNILEIGCGVGQFAHYLHDAGAKQYTGIDFSKEAIIRCKEKNLTPYKFIEGSIYDSLYFDGSFDCVVGLETLEHVDDIKVISNIKEGAHCVFSVPTFNNEAHLIHFISKEQVIERYGKYFEITTVERIIDWFIFAGVKK